MPNKDSLEKKSRFQVPDTYVIVFFLIILAVILAYLLPSGSYSLLSDASGKNIGVDPTSFKFTQEPHLSLRTIFVAPYTGLVNSAKTIFFVFIVGGIFQIITATGTLDSVIGVTINKLQNRAVFVFPVIAVMMMLLGAVGVGNNVAVVFTPIGIILCKKFGLDPIVAVATFYLASNTGFAASPINPFTVLLAQDLSGVPYMSGFAMRSVIFVVVCCMCAFYLTRYCIRVIKDPSKAYMEPFAIDETEKGKVFTISMSQMIVFIALIFAFATYTWGAIKYSWGMDILSGIMMALGLFVGIITGMGANSIAKNFVEGCKAMVFSGVLIGLAAAITVVLNSASVIHTIVYYLCIPLSKLPTSLAAVAMYFVNCAVNVFIPSGSGQAYVVIPIMAPMADVLGFSRQVAISAFQFGDGFMNGMQPTGGLMMGCIGIAGVQFTKWLRFNAPLFFATSVVCCTFLMVMVWIGWQ